MLPFRNRPTGLSHGGGVISKGLKEDVQTVDGIKR